MIPGLAMFTARAEPLATWMTGLEVAYFKVSSSPGGRLLVCHTCMYVFATERLSLWVFPIALSYAVPVTRRVDSKTVTGASSTCQLACPLMKTI